MTKDMFQSDFEEDKSGFNHFKMTPKHILSCITRMKMNIYHKMLSHVH